VLISLPLDKEMRLHQRLPYLGLASVFTVHGVAGSGFSAGTHVVLTDIATPIYSYGLQDRRGIGSASSDLVGVQQIKSPHPALPR